MRIQTKDILEHVGKRFDNIDQELLQVNTKLDAIMSGEVLVTRKQLERLLQALKDKGIDLDETKILAA